MQINVIHMYDHRSFTFSSPEAATFLEAPWIESSGRDQFCSPRTTDSRSTAQSQGLEEVEFGVKIADQRTIDIFHEALNFGLKLLSAGDLQMKEKQYEVLKSVATANHKFISYLPPFTISWTSLDHQEIKSQRLL